MENRKPYQLRKIIIAYNLFQVILSLKICYDAAVLGWITSGDHAYNWRCQNIDRSPTGLPLQVSRQHLNTC
jgi:elongation of very long chain fatty acids protein 7